MPVFYHWETNLLLDTSGTLQEIPERPRKGRNEKPGELIAWQSLPGADVQSAGSVHFSRIGGGESTRVKVALQYLPPVGKVGAFVAHLLGSASEQQLEILDWPFCGDMQRTPGWMLAARFGSSHKCLGTTHARQPL